MKYRNKPKTTKAPKPGYDYSDLKIDKGIPIPSKRGDRIMHLRKTLEALKPGDSIGDLSKGMAGNIQSFARRVYGMDTIVRRETSNTYRIWYVKS